jgi:hypothetical protein
MKLIENMNEQTKNIITWLLCIAAISTLLYDITQNPQYGRKCELNDIYGNTITGNCSYIIEYYHSQQNIADYINLVTRLANSTTTDTQTTTTLTTEQIKEKYCPTTTTTTITITSTTILEYTEVKINIITTTTYKLKHQGNFSSNKATTTTTTTTLPRIYDFMLTCQNNSECTLTSGCCPCTTGGKAIAMNKRYVKSWKERLDCPLGIKCQGSLKPCENYKAECVNQTCTKTIQ